MKNKLENIKIIITCQYKLRVNVINIITPLLLIMASYYWILCTRHGFKRHVRAVLSCFSYVQLFVTPWTVACHISLSTGFFRQEYLSGLPCPPPWDLPNAGIEPRSPTLWVDSSLLSKPPGSPWIIEKARELQKNIYLCFIDCAKAFDCVDHNKLENS